VDSRIHKESILDTCSVNGKVKLYKDIETCKGIVWSEIFTMNSNIKIKNHLFDHSIVTDGYSASVRFIHRDSVQKMENTKKAKKVAQKALVGLTKEQKAIIREEKKKIKEDKEKKKNEERKNKKKEGPDNAKKTRTNRKRIRVCTR